MNGSFIIRKWALTVTQVTSAPVSINVVHVTFPTLPAACIVLFLCRARGVISFEVDFHPSAATSIWSLKYMTWFIARSPEVICQGSLELGYTIVLCSNKMAEDSQNMRAAVSEIARQAYILLQSYRREPSLNLNSIERILVEPSSFNSPRQPVLQSGSSSSSTTARPQPY